MIKLVNVIQDGGVFLLDNEENEPTVLLANYGSMVAHDYDIEGAKKARELFAKNFPQYLENE